MPIKIEIRDSQRKSLSDYFKTREAAVLQQINDLQDELNGIRQNIVSLNGGLPKVDRNPDTDLFDGFIYNQKWTLNRKIQFVLQSLHKPLGSGEIADYILKNYEPNLDRGKLVGGVSALLTNKKGKSIYRREKNERNQNVFTMAEKETVA